MITRIHYFGCGNEAGHYLHPRLPREIGRLFENLDGKLCPPRSDGLYNIAVNRLGGLDVLALAWWDQSVDKREGSNSIVFYPGCLTPRDVALKEFVRVFPWAFKRIPKPLVWHSVSNNPPSPSPGCQQMEP